MAKEITDLGVAGGAIIPAHYGQKRRVRVPFVSDEVPQHRQHAVILRDVHEAPSQTAVSCQLSWFGPECGPEARWNNMKTCMANAALGLGALLILSSTGRAQADWSAPLEYARQSEPGPYGPQFKIGDRVHIEASNHWVPCVVEENSPPSIMRVRCEAYPKLSRAEGLYGVDRDNERAVRPARAGLPGPITAKTPPRQAAQAGGGGLKVGEYACYGSGGRILAGLGFTVLSGNRFTDLDGGNAGTYSVNGSTVTFRGGHLGGQTGRELRNYNFRIGAQATCEPF